MSVDAGDALKFLNLVGELYAASRKSYAEGRRLAKQSLSKADLDAADARYGFTYLPPPPGWTGGTPPPDPPPVDVAPYMELQDEQPIPEDAELLARGYKVGDVIVPAADGRWLVVAKGQRLLGMVPLRTIGETP